MLKGDNSNKKLKKSMGDVESGGRADELSREPRKIEKTYNSHVATSVKIAHKRLVEGHILVTSCRANCKISYDTCFQISDSFTTCTFLMAAVLGIFVSKEKLNPSPVPRGNKSRVLSQWSPPTLNCSILSPVLRSRATHPYTTSRSRVSQKHLLLI